MIFRIDYNKVGLRGRVIYRPDEFSFDFQPYYPGGTSLLINSLQLEVDWKGRVLYAWGYCPHVTWERTNEPVPDFAPGVLRFLSDGRLIPGVSIPITPDGGWPVSVNVQTGWVHIGTYSPAVMGAEVVEFASDSVAAIVGGRLVSVWLRPETLPPFGDD